MANIRHRAHRPARRSTFAPSPLPPAVGRAHLLQSKRVHPLPLPPPSLTTPNVAVAFLHSPHTRAPAGRRRSRSVVSEALPLPGQTAEAAVLLPRAPGPGSLCCRAQATRRWWARTHPPATNAASRTGARHLPQRPRCGFRSRTIAERGRDHEGRAKLGSWNLGSNCTSSSSSSFTLTLPKTSDTRM